jgi:TonB family protein
MGVESKETSVPVRNSVALPTRGSSVFAPDDPGQRLKERMEPLAQEGRIDVLPNPQATSSHHQHEDRHATPVAYRSNPAPTYPFLARKLGWVGEVKVRVLVQPDGGVAKVHIASSSGYPNLDESALRSVKDWNFVPATDGNRSISAWVLVPVVFQLEP